MTTKLRERRDKGDRRPPTLFEWMTGIQFAEALPDFHLVFKGYRFYPPFICMCCGKVVDAVQWAYGRTCASCDVGACDRHNRQPAEHPRPAFRNSFERYVEYVEAVPADEYGNA